MAAAAAPSFGGPAVRAQAGNKLECGGGKMEVEGENGEGEGLGAGVGNGRGHGAGGRGHSAEMATPGMAESATAGVD
jgi:hypothetical protein